MSIQFIYIHTATVPRDRLKLLPGKNLSPPLSVCLILRLQLWRHAKAYRGSQHVSVEHVLFLLLVANIAPSSTARSP